MPWVLRGDAPAAQDDWLKAHLAGCPACRQEFAQQERLRRALSLPSDLPLDAEAGLARLLGRIDEAEAKPAMTRRLASSGWLVRGLVAAVLVQAVGIGVLGVKLRGEASAPAAYRTFSQPEAPAARGSLRVVPQASMKVAEWNRVLQDFHLRVVGGPNDVGAYTVVASDGGGAFSRENLQRLRATPGIRFAEPVSETP
jgi:anti-sigma factor RsiW